MAVVTIDADALLGAINQLAQIVQSSIKKEPVIKEQKKRGRPKKEDVGSGMCPKCSKTYMYCSCGDNSKRVEPLSKASQILSKDNSEVQSIIEEDNQKDRTPRQKANYIFNIKGKGGRKVLCQKEPVTKNRGEMKFMDEPSVSHTDNPTNWQPTDRRTPAQMFDFICFKCNRPFTDYPSNHPEAFFGAGGTDESGISEESHSVLCNRCGVK